MLKVLAEFVETSSVAHENGALILKNLPGSIPSKTLRRRHCPVFF